MDAHRLGQWFCKTCCNLLAVSKAHIPTPLRDYAFSVSDNPEVRFYLPFKTGTRLNLEPGRYGSYSFHHPTDLDALFVVLPFEGLPMVVSTIELDEVTQADLAASIGLTREPVWRDRIRAMRHEVFQYPRGEIVLNWGASTSVSTFVESDTSTGPPLISPDLQDDSGARREMGALRR